MSYSDLLRAVVANPVEPKTHALSFNGSNQYGIISHDANLDLQTLTIMFWMKRTGTFANNHCIISRGVSTSPTEVPYRFNYTSNVLQFQYFPGSSGRLVTLGVPPLNEWVHITGVAEKSGDNTILSSYINGVLEQTGTFEDNIPIRTSDLFIGAENNRRFAKVDLDEIRIYNYPLTQAEIQATYNKQLNSSESGLVYYWNLNEGSGTSAFDLVANKEMQLQNNPTWITDTPFQ